MIPLNAMNSWVFSGEPNHIKTIWATVNKIAQKHHSVLNAKFKLGYQLPKGFVEPVDIPNNPHMPALVEGALQVCFDSSITKIIHSKNAFHST
jgi:hypothetical protein